MTPAPHLHPLGGGDPKSIGEWRLLGRLGAGGMGVVYLAERLGGEQAALKIIHAGYAHDPTFRTRFKREVHASRSVRGRYVASVLDADTDGDPAWLATRYIPGPTLSTFVDDHGPLPDDLVLPLAAGLLEGLATIHRAGIVHRDLKPSNVLLTEDAPIIIDFGVATAADATSLTGTGIVVGSAGWMAPEQLRGTSAGPPADIFAWGALVAFAATGRPPFGTGRPDALGYRVAHEPPDLVGLPSPLRTVIEEALRKDAAERPSLDDLRARLGSDADATVATIAAGWEAPTEIATLASPVDLVPPGRSRPSWRSTAFVGAVVATLIAAFAVYLLGSSGNSTDSLTQRDASVTNSSTTTTTTRPTSTSTTSPPTTTTGSSSANLVSPNVDADPSHWRPSTYQADQSLTVRVFDATDWQLVYDFPVNMNGCSTGQTRVRWRSLGQPVMSGISLFKDSFDDSPVMPDPTGGPSMTGTMVFSNCEQPAFVAAPGDSISDIVVDASFHSPAAG